MAKKEIKKPAKKTNFESKVIDRMDKIITLLKPEISGAVAKSPSVTVQVKKDERFIDNNDGTILDMETSLMWAKEGSSKELNFADAEKYCKDSKIGGFKDWRLPTVKELISIVDYEKYRPAINPVFKCESSWYWSGSSYADGADSAWVVYFGSGGVSWYGGSGGNYVRPVRQYLK